MSNASRIFEQYYVGGYGKKGDKIRLNDTCIQSNGVSIAEIVSLEDYEYYHDFLIVTMEHYKSKPNWESHKKQLVKEANKNDLPVLFVPTIDIGFGVSKDIFKYTDDIQLTKNLIKVAKYSQDNDIKTACCAISDGKIIAYSYNQYLDGEWRHAEQILTDYISLLNINQEIPLDNIKYVSMLEPCDKCLKAMLNTNAQHIEFCTLHKEKWNNDNYIYLTNELARGSYRTSNNLLVKYTRWHNDRVESFYDKKE